MPQTNSAQRQQQQHQHCSLGMPDRSDRPVGCTDAQVGCTGRKHRTVEPRRLQVEEDRSGGPVGRTGRTDRSDFTRFMPTVLSVICQPVGRTGRTPSVTLRWCTDRSGRPVGSVRTATGASQTQLKSFGFVG